MRLLITNDDGIASEGIHVLARAMLAAGHEVTVAAPDSDYSGVGASLGGLSADDTIEVAEVTIPDGEGIRAWSVAGAPALCVLAGRLGAFGEPPDLVVSGINAGLNTGRSILHSGTVGAALTAQNFGVSGLAVSVAGGEQWHWDTAARCAVDALRLLIDAPPRSVLNLNVPSRPFGELEGTRWTRLAAFGAVRAATAGVAEGRLQIEVTAYGEPGDGPDLATDQGAVRAGYASLTTLGGLAEAWSGTDDAPGEPAVREAVVPGAPLEDVHRVPDASDHRSLRRPGSAYDELLLD
ncbi:MAG: 5'/3'-nucleotidase SurE [Acidimicrobiia bacterium]|nr:5'/3'-nucleotidase SurE [Acidimicrobiia bacterium]